LQTDHHIGIDEIDLILLEEPPPIRADKPAGIDNYLIGIEPLSAVNQALGPDNYGYEMPSRRRGTDEIQRRERQFLEALKRVGGYA
jgi:hypothetical protein